MAAKEGEFPGYCTSPKDPTVFEPCIVKVKPGDVLIPCELLQKIGCISGVQKL